MRLCHVLSARFAAPLLVAVLLAANGSGFAQSPAAATQSTAATQPAAPGPAANSANGAPSAVFRSTAALVLVDVVVGNAAGPVHGVARSQFRLLEDGKEQKLIGLEEHTAVDPATVQAPPALPPNIYSNVPETAGSGAISGAVNVLLLDALNTPIADQARVRQQMISYLKTVQPGTRMAIFTLASRLRMVQGFTTDSRPLLAALGEQKRGKAKASQSSSPTQSALLADPYDTTDSDIADTMSQLGATADALAILQQFQADTAAFQMDLRVRATLDALQTLARYLRGVPGRKNLIWFSGSFPLSLDPDANLQSPFEAMRVYSQQVAETTGMLAASRVAVYPVDARGLFNDPRYDVQTSGSGMISHGRTPPAFTQSAGKFFQQTAAEHATMQQIAEETGGRAYFDTNGIKEAVAQAVQTGANYYTLAYIPTSKADDGRFHKIQVTIPDAPSYKLVYRRGYTADTPKKRAANEPVSGVMAAMLRGAPPFSEIVFKMRVLPYDDPAFKGLPPPTGPGGDLSPKVKGPVKRYSLDYAADLHGASIAQTPDGLSHASLEFVAVAYDRDGERLNSVDKAFTVNMNEDQYKQVMQKGLQIHQQIDLPAGEVYLRAGVHDLVSDRVGSVEVPLMVKARD
jgi:VWFA-related protein